MPSKDEERLYAQIFEFDEVYHRGFFYQEAGERHLMLWENCPLHDGPSEIKPHFIQSMDEVETEEVILCEVCFGDELRKEQN